MEQIKEKVDKDTEFIVVHPINVIELRPLSKPAKISTMTIGEITIEYGNNTLNNPKPPILLFPVDR